LNALLDWFVLGMSTYWPVSVNRPAPPISGYSASETGEVIATTDESPARIFTDPPSATALLDLHRVDQSGALHLGDFERSPTGVMDLSIYFRARTTLR
jgi:hypothetical protein